MQNTSQTENGFWHIDLQEFVCGWGASFINIGITYPVYKIMFRQVLETKWNITEILLFETLISIP